MKPLIYLILPALLLTLSRCRQPEMPQAFRAVPVDSFLIEGIDIGQQVDNFHYINDSTLCSYDLSNKNLVFFYKDKNGNYKATAKKEIDTEFWSMFFRGHDGKNYFTDANKAVTEYNTTADTLRKRYTIPHRFPQLKDSFALSVANNSPVLVCHDTLIAVISPNSNESLRLYFKEQEIAEFRIDAAKDTLSYLRSYISKPTGLSDYDYPLGMHTFHNNTIFMLYPQFDTIYSFNRSTNTLQKTQVNNPDFIQPDKFTCRAFTSGYGACATKYYLHNFRYYGIHFNTLTKHFLLFYNAPVTDKKDHTPTFEDQPLQVLVLDEQLRTVKHYTFDKRLETGASFFMIPGKGLAMPLLNEHYESTRFYIYNL